MADSQGTFVWYDLITTDVDRAIASYTDVAGWGTQPFGEGYVGWEAGETPVGGDRVAGCHDPQGGPFALHGS